MKRGDVFTHTFWLDAEHKPLQCRVTKLAQGVIYYRPVNGGSPMYFPVEQQAKYVMSNDGYCVGPADSERPCGKCGSLPGQSCLLP